MGRSWEYEINATRAAKQGYGVASGWAGLGLELWSGIHWGHSQHLAGSQNVLFRANKSPANRQQQQSQQQLRQHRSSSSSNCRQINKFSLPFGVVLGGVACCRCCAAIWLRWNKPKNKANLATLEIVQFVFFFQSEVYLRSSNCGHTHGKFYF